MPLKLGHYYFNELLPPSDGNFHRRCKYDTKQVNKIIVGQKKAVKTLTADLPGQVENILPVED